MPLRPQEIRTLIEDHGQTVTLRYVTEGTYDPSTGGLTGGSNTDSTVLAYFYNYALDEIDGSNVISGDRRVVLPTVDSSGDTLTEPSIDDEIIGQGDTVKIVRVEKVYSDVLVCYMLQVRE